LPPKKTGPNVVIVNVVRNKQPPVFQNEPYIKRIDQNVGQGTEIITVTATDSDEKVRIVEISPMVVYPYRVL